MANTLIGMNPEESSVRTIMTAWRTGLSLGWQLANEGFLSADGVVILSSPGRLAPPMEEWIEEVIEEGVVQNTVDAIAAFRRGVRVAAFETLDDLIRDRDGEMPSIDCISSFKRGRENALADLRRHEAAWKDLCDKGSSDADIARFARETLGALLDGAVAHVERQLHTYSEIEKMSVEAHV